MAIGTSSRVSTPAFHADDPDPTTEYRTLSGLAIISLVIGLVSPLCFGAPLLMAIPFFGVAVSLIALRRIAMSDGVLAGRWAAIAGLVLCAVFAIAPFSRDLVLRSMRSHQAEDFGRQWLALVLSGRTEQAFRLTVDSTRPQPPPEPGETKSKPTPYATFMALPAVKALAAAGAESDVRFDGTVGYDRPSSRQVFVRQQYEIIPHAAKSGANPSAPPIDVLLFVERTRLAPEGRSRWLVHSMELATAPAAAATHP